MKFSFSVFSLIIFLAACSFAQSGWSLQTNPLGVGENAMIGKIRFVSPTEGWIATGDGKLLHTSNGGSSWLLVDPFNGDTLSGFSDPALNMSWIGQNNGWVFFTKGSIDTAWGMVVIRTTNGGTTWNKINISDVPGDAAFQIQFVDAFNGWLLGYNFSTGTPLFLKTSDGGTTWNTFNGNGIFYFVDVNNGWSYNGSGPGGSNPPYKISRTTDGGANWNQQYADNTLGAFNGMQFTDLNNGWVVGNNGKVMKTTNGGTDWIIVNNSGINPSASCKTLFFIDANTGWIPSKSSGEFPFLQHTTDGGLSWTTQSTPLGNSGNNAIFSIFFIDSQNGWLTADYGRICHTTSGGVTGVNDPGIPSQYYLEQNFPNPFNPASSITFGLPQESFVSVKVYDVLGNLITSLVNEIKQAGSHTVRFDGSSLPSGTYIYRITAGTYTQSRKMIMIK